MLHTACFTTNGNLPLEAMSNVQGWILKVDQTANSAPPPPSSDESGMMQPTASTRQTAVPPQRRFAAAAEAWCRVPPAALKCAQGRGYIYIKLQVQETGHVSLPTHVHSFVGTQLPLMQASANQGQDLSRRLNTQLSQSIININIYIYQ